MDYACDVRNEDCKSAHTLFNPVRVCSHILTIPHTICTQHQKDKADKLIGTGMTEMQRNVLSLVCAAIEQDLRSVCSFASLTPFLIASLSHASLNARARARTHTHTHTHIRCERATK